MTRFASVRANSTHWNETYYVVQHVLACAPQEGGKKIMYVGVQVPSTLDHSLSIFFLYDDHIIVQLPNIQSMPSYSYDKFVVIKQVGKR